MNIRKSLILLIFLILIISNSFAQKEKTDIIWIFLRPQYVEKFSDNKIDYSQETLTRLSRNHWQTNFSDYFPPENILREIQKQVTKIRHYSRSLCAYSVLATKTEQRKIISLPYVQDIAAVNVRTIERNRPENGPLDFGLSKIGSFYGNSLEQLEQLNITKAHELGLSGAGVKIAVADAGFRKDHEAFEYLKKNQRLIDEYDFINNDKNVQDEVAADTAGWENQHDHGTAVLSCICGYVPEQLIGPAYNAEILLAKTEVLGSETRIEEDNYVAALEWAESKNAAIFSTSLGYRDFDDFEYPFSDLDGQTAVTSRAVNWAFSRGMLVVTAAGNDAYYFEDGGIVTPGDAPGALTVGAVDETGQIASFSSYGPTYDGRQKPEICARGYRTFVANAYETNAYRYSNGTSFATPLIAGACALILEKYPHWTPATLISNMKKFSDRANLPDRQYGWGIPDIYQLITETTDTTVINIEMTKDILIAPNPVATEANIYIRWNHPDIKPEDTYTIAIYSIKGEQVFSKQLSSKSDGMVDRITWNLKNNGGKKVSSGIYLVKLTGNKMNKINKFTILK
jgi:hypothetical protein